MIIDLIPLQAEQNYIMDTFAFELESFLELVIRFSFNLLVVGILVRGLYYTLTRKKNYMFSFLLIGVVTFLVCYLLESLSLNIGFALGLFAIFTIIRYRTNPIPIKEMTYMFVIIGVSVVNGLTTKEVSYLELVFVNIMIILVVYVLERLRRAEMIQDLKQRTGLPINRVEIGRINFLRDTVRLLIYYPEDTDNMVDDVEVVSLDDSRTE